MAETTTRKPAAMKADPAPEADTATAGPRNVIEAIVAVMRDVSHVGKDGRNVKQNYNFRGIDAAVNALGPAMRRHGLLAVPHVESYEYGEVVVGGNRTKQAHVKVRVTYTFHHSNPNTGEMTSLSVEVPGEAMDSGDKATAKAMSVAFRIALLQSFALPTDEPDADHSSVTRGHAVVVPTADEVRGACQWASEQPDIDGSYSYIHERFGEGLAQVVVSKPDGDSLVGDQYVEWARTQAAEQRAEATRAQQDTDAHTADHVAAPAPAQPAAAPQPAAQPAPAQPAAEPAATAPPTPPKETRAARNMRIVTDELAFQSDAMGVPFDQWALGASDSKGLVFSKAAKFITSNRPNVIEALRQAGRATEAEAYTKIGDGFPIELHIIFEALDREDQRA